MKKLNKRELTLLLITIAVGVGAFGYIYVIEPVLKYTLVSDSVISRYKGYMSLVNNQSAIEQRSKNILPADYRKDTPEEQQISMQVYIEKLTRSSGITKINSIYPLQIQKTEKEPFQELALQLDMECSLYSITKLLYNIGISDIPLKVKQLKIFSETNDPGMLQVQIEVASIWIRR
jgi:hypothetical protein